MHEIRRAFFLFATVSLACSLTNQRRRGPDWVWKMPFLSSETGLWKVCSGVNAFYEWKHCAEIEFGRMKIRVWRLRVIGTHVLIVSLRRRRVTSRLWVWSNRSWSAGLRNFVQSLQLVTQRERVTISFSNGLCCSSIANSRMINDAKRAGFSLSKIRHSPTWD